MSYPFPTFPLVNRVGITTPAANIDARYGPWPTFNDALTGFNTGLRFPGLTVAVSSVGGITEYWYKNGVADSNLVLKLSAVTGGGGTVLPGDILPTVTNYLSTNNVLVSGLSVTGSLSTQNFGTSKDWSYKQDFIGTVNLTSTTFLELLANRNTIQYEASASLTGFQNPHGTVVVNNKIYISSQSGTGNNGLITVINDPLGDLTNQTLITLANETYIPELCYHKQTDRIYGIVGATNGQHKVIRLNPNTNTYDTFYSLVGESVNGNYTITNDDEYLYVAVFSKIFRIRISDATLVNTYQNFFNLQVPHTIKISPDGRYILCASSPSGNNFHRIDIQTGVVNTVGLGRIFTDDSAVIGDYFYILSEDSGGVAYKINWKDLTWRILYTGRPGWGLTTDGRFVYFTHNYTGSPGGFPTPQDAAFIHKYDPDNESWHTVYLATTIPLFNVANRMNEILFLNDKVFLTNYGSGNDSVFRAKIRTEVTTVPILRDDRTNWNIDAPPVYNLFVNSVSASGVVYASNTDLQVLQLTNNLPQNTNNFINSMSFGVVTQTVSGDQNYVIGSLLEGMTITLFVSGNHETLKRHTINTGGTLTRINGTGQANQFYTFKNHITKVILTRQSINRITGTAEIIRTDLNTSQGGLGFLSLEQGGTIEQILQEDGDRLVIRNFT
jgi:hypothetical protein